MKTIFALLWATALLHGAGPARAGETIDYLYRLHCSGCHGLDGLGSKIGRIPPFPGIVGHFADTQDGRLYLVQVPGVANAELPDAETAALLNYVLQIWGEREPSRGVNDFTADEVRRLRGVRVDDVVKLRHEIETRLARRNISIGY